jgi:MFS family permease
MPARSHKIKDDFDAGTRRKIERGWRKPALQYADIVVAVLGVLAVAWIADLLSGKRGYFAALLVAGVGAVCGWFLPIRVFAFTTMDGWLWVVWSLCRRGPEPGRLLSVPEQALMGPRTRRAIAALGVCAFLIFYVWAVISIGAHLPDNQIVRLLFYGISGHRLGRAPAAPAELGREEAEVADCGIAKGPPESDPFNQPSSMRKMVGATGFEPATP